MGLFNQITNYFNAIVGRNQDFANLIANKDVSRIRALMDYKDDEVDNARREYDIYTHEIMKRKDKILKDIEGNRVGSVTRWKLPINYPVYINEIALVFIYGRPVKWSQSSEGTDNAFNAYTDLLKKMRFDSKVRQMKRLAGAETQSAMLYRVFRNDEGKPDCQIRVLARSKGDEIYTRWDIYENLISFAWGYRVKDGDSKTTYHLDIFTNEMIWHCTQVAFGWEIEPEVNLIGKIPVILDEQNKEWKGVEPMIGREEYIGSRTADTNDYFSDPYFVTKASIVKNMPKKDSENKTLITSDNVDDVSKVAHYLTWDSAPESKKNEVDWLKKHILTKTFTPEIDFDTMKSLSNVSGKALSQMMLLANIKAQKHKELHDELLDRTASLVKSIIGNVLNVSLKSECDNLVIEHEFQEPFGEDIADTINNIDKSISGGFMSTETGVEQNPLIKDHQAEMKKINDEKTQAAQLQQDIFKQTETTDDIKGGAE